MAKSTAYYAAKYALCERAFRQFFVKVSKYIIFLVKSFLGNFY